MSQNNPEPIREVLGRVVRETWVKYCIQTGRTDKPSHLLAWDAISEWDKEADRVIGEAVVEFERQRIYRECVEMFDDEVMG